MIRHAILKKNDKNRWNVAVIFLRFHFLMCTVSGFNENHTWYIVITSMWFECNKYFISFRKCNLFDLFLIVYRLCRKIKRGQSRRMTKLIQSRIDAGSFRQIHRIGSHYEWHEKVKTLLLEIRRSREITSNRSI